MPQPIYMDSHATTPIDPRVLEAMMPYLTTHFGNAAVARTYSGSAQRMRWTPHGVRSQI